ncbi:hypothetical protein Agub_g14704, partial [Astrephomene gubernaculifera]
MPESELLLPGVTRSDIQAAPLAVEVDVERSATSGDGDGPPSPQRTTPPAAASTAINVVPVPERRPSIWQLPFCAPDLSWLSIANTLLYLSLICLNVLVYSEAVWPGVGEVDRKYGPLLTPASWSYHLRDLIMFLWGLAVAAQSLAEHLGWRDYLQHRLGSLWRIQWCADCIWLVLHVSGNMAAAAVFSATSLCAALLGMHLQASLMRELHPRMQEEGQPGVPALAYLLFAAPTSLSAGWLLANQCHAITAAVVRADNGSQTIALPLGCCLIALAACMALSHLARTRDVLFGLGFAWAALAMSVSSGGYAGTYIDNGDGTYSYGYANSSSDSSGMGTGGGSGMGGSMAPLDDGYTLPPMGGLGGGGGGDYGGGGGYGNATASLGGDGDYSGYGDGSGAYYEGYRPDQLIALFAGFVVAIVAFGMVSVPLGQGMVATVRGGRGGGRGGARGGRIGGGGSGGAGAAG